MTTFVDLAGAEYPEAFHEERIPPMEGRSMLSFLLGKPFWLVAKKA